MEGQLSTRKWKDEQSGQDKYSTEILLQGYNSTLTMLGGKNSPSENFDQSKEAKSSLPDDSSDVQTSELDDEIPF